MVQGLIGRKLGMTQVFDESGVALPVTVVEVEPNYVTQVKNLQSDGYSAVQLGYGEVKRLNRAEAGHVKGTAKVRHLREVAPLGEESPKIGDRIDIGIFAKGDSVDVSGISKGKGFAGVVKRHHFAGGPKTHGQSDRHRAPGSVGASSTPGRVFKGMRMAGHLGAHRNTVLNLRIVDLIMDRNLVLIRGAVPGPKNGLVLVRKAVKART